jgi:DNA ligase-1
MLITHLEAIEAAPRGNARLEAVGQAITDGGPLVRRFLVEANNPFITFGIAKLPKPEAGGLFFQHDEQWATELFRLGEALASRKLTGNEMRAKVAAFLDDCNEPQKKWASRFFLKDLRLNIGAKEIQKFVGKEELPLFEVPLAHDYKDVTKWPAGVTWHVQPKLDGGRCVAVIDRQGGVELFSRTGKTWGNFESVRKSLQQWAASHKIVDTVFDGEVVSLDETGRIDFQQIQKTMMRKDGVEVGQLQYVVFDVASMKEWQTPTLAYGRRYDNLRAIDAAFPLPDNIVVIETVLASGIVSGIEALSKAYVERGYEGGIARRHDAPVQNKRSKDLLKIKTFMDAEATVTGMVEGTGKYAGMLGALQCKLDTGVAFEIGSGFDDRQRRVFWEDDSILTGNPKVTFKYFEMTDDGVPRFPIFKGFRSEDDIGEAK